MGTILVWPCVVHAGWRGSAFASLESNGTIEGYFECEHSKLSYNLNNVDDGLFDPVLRVPLCLANSKTDQLPTLFMHLPHATIHLHCSPSRALWSGCPP